MITTNTVMEQQRPNEPEGCEHALQEREDQTVSGKKATHIIDTELEWVRLLWSQRKHLEQ